MPGDTSDEISDSSSAESETNMKQKKITKRGKSSKPKSKKKKIGKILIMFSKNLRITL